ncbi:hypothetical protein AWB78_07109 [Caballeronia calidae]|uniref:Uncharacterized protein n=1 Tax=Caballeronia calidae TaxID=1777139 RepID=A0A158ECZ7_9BURK|nr:hypothetical protein AWB78_07109 [Caballeronia calidae]
MNLPIQSRTSENHGFPDLTLKTPGTLGMTTLETL